MATEPVVYVRLFMPVKLVTNTGGFVALQDSMQKHTKK